MKKYEIVRFYQDSNHPKHNTVIKRNLVEGKAREWCQREDTHKIGVWFDGYREQS